MPETSLTFWRRLSKLRTALREDDQLRERFDQNPIAVLKERDLDIEVTMAEGSEQQVSLSTILEGMSELERRATIYSLMEIGNPRDLERLRIGFGIANVNVVVNANAAANANAVANANALANANANANANVNANVNVNADASALSAADATANVEAAASSFPSAVAIDLPASAYQWQLNIVLPPDFVSSALATELRELRLNDARQKALLKRAATDPNSLVSRKMIGDGELRLVEYTYRGIAFRVEVVLSGNDLIIRHTQILRKQIRR